MRRQLLCVWGACPVVDELLGDVCMPSRCDAGYMGSWEALSRGRGHLIDCIDAEVPYSEAVGALVLWFRTLVWGALGRCRDPLATASMTWSLASMIVFRQLQRRGELQRPAKHVQLQPVYSAVLSWQWPRFRSAA